VAHATGPDDRNDFIRAKADTWTKHRRAAISYVYKSFGSFGAFGSRTQEDAACRPTAESEHAAAAKIEAGERYARVPKWDIGW
jgi:hypothetical protein